MQRVNAPYSWFTKTLLQVFLQSVNIELRVASQPDGYGGSNTCAGRFTQARINN